MPAAQAQKGTDATKAKALEGLLPKGRMVSRALVHKASQEAAL